jgi:hypothetical protein
MISTEVFGKELESIFNLPEDLELEEHLGAKDANQQDRK